MSWLSWLGCSLAFLALGGYAMRAGQTGIVRIYAVSCIVLFLMTMFRFGYLFGETFAPWPWILCTALAPATVILAVIALQRDRYRVMGPPGGPEATASAAIVYGAGNMHEPGGVDAGSGGEM